MDMVSKLLLTITAECGACRIKGTFMVPTKSFESPAVVAIYLAKLGLQNFPGVREKLITL